MRISKHRRIARLESLAGAYIEEQKRRDEARDASLRKRATEHAVRLAAVVQCGQPSIDEPLPAAWERALDTLLRERPAIRELFRTSPEGAGAVAHLQSIILPQLRGGIEADKFQHVMDRAPPWLLVFTGASLTANILELKLPPLDEAPQPGVKARKEALDKWPHLPECCFDSGGHPSDFDGLSADDLVFWIEKTQRRYEDLTRHERRRLREIFERLP
jgi:hypothetical protein